MTPAEIHRLRLEMRARFDATSADWTPVRGRVAFALDEALRVEQGRMYSGWWRQFGEDRFDAAVRDGTFARRYVIPAMKSLERMLGALEKKGCGPRAIDRVFLARCPACGTDDGLVVFVHDGRLWVHCIAERQEPSVGGDPR
jgi:hypothetical protein